ncbi:TetR/AcrR family transcriptional regulator [Companilactobacillus keshanensis]|uniref:TetR/AcrR family transcriptional regulator n=1 Tax=Companilactobacillus keshanensis TaxID=2486003 RepID=A0ABW4BT08_9LACO|nr:TetR/AcrR family transcriptional regulator [Companilactobacillus keshanensis]
MNQTASYLLKVLEKELSKKRLDKFTMADLIRSSGVKRSTIYYYFGDLNEVYDAYLENLLTRRIVLTNINEQISELVYFISNKEILCLNLYNLTKAQVRRNHFLKLLSESFQQFDLCSEEQGTYLVGGFLFILINWFDTELDEHNRIILKQLLDYVEFVRTRK